MKFDFTAEEVGDVLAGLDKLKDGEFDKASTICAQMVLSQDEVMLHVNCAFGRIGRYDLLMKKIGDIVDERR